MTLKTDEPADEWREIDRWDGGVGWIAHPEEALQRASHAIVVDSGAERTGDGSVAPDDDEGGLPDDEEGLPDDHDGVAPDDDEGGMSDDDEGVAPDDEGDVPDGDVWVIDPLDVTGLDDLLADLGDVAGVAVLVDRHERDAAEVATRHGVSVWLPEWIDGVAEDLDAPVERFGETLPGSAYRVVPVLDNRFWQEAALFDGSTLVVPEAVGTTAYFRSGRRELGVHPVLRLRPPRKSLGRFTPNRILVGHGEGIDEDAAAVLQGALSDARRTAPRAYANAALDLFGRRR